MNIVTGGEIFQRYIRVEVGKLNATRALMISDLHIDFETKDGEGIDSSGVIKIFNLSNAVYQEIRNSEVLVLKVGHKVGNVPRVVFVGKIESVTNDRIGGDVMTAITCNGGTKARGKTVSKKYEENTSVEKILRDLAKEMGFAVEIAESAISKFKLSSKKYSGGLTVHGKACDELVEIANDSGLEARIDDVKIRLIEKGSSSVKKAYIITEDSGLLVAPNEIEITENGGKIRGWNCRSILYPDISRGSVVMVKNDSDKLVKYLVLSRIHKGSNYSTTFETDMNLMEIK